MTWKPCALLWIEITGRHYMIFGFWNKLILPFSYTTAPHHGWAVAAIWTVGNRSMAGLKPISYQSGKCAAFCQDNPGWNNRCQPGPSAADPEKVTQPMKGTPAIAALGTWLQLDDIEGFTMSVRRMLIIL